MLSKNFLLEKIRNNKSAIGTWSNVPSPAVTDIIASSGLDFVILDTEHGTLTPDMIATMISICEAKSVSPMVRVSGVNESEILKALDSGAHGIHVPNVESLESAKQIIQYAKYPPHGKRGLSPFTRAGNYDKANAEKLVATANQNTLIAIHIEGANAFKSIDQFLALSGVDILFVGLYDLSKSLGLPGKVDHPEVVSFLKNAVEQSKATKKIIGTIVTHDDQLRAALEMGVKYITYSVDCSVLKESYVKVKNVFNESAKILEQ